VISPQISKPEIRKQMLAMREQLSPVNHASYSAAIIDRIVQLPEYRQAKVVLGYMNIGAEFSSELWIASVLANNKRLVLPRVNHHTNQLDLFWVDDLESQLQPGLWGIREPVVERCKRLDRLNEVEFALLPGVAFTRKGERLGYGGGYYDKLLAGNNLDFCVQLPVLAAAAFSLQLVGHIPQEATDVKVDWIITEQEMIRCSEQE